MTNNIYLQVSQEDEHGWLRNFYPCTSKEEADEAFKAIVSRYKEANKDKLTEIDLDEDEDDNFYAYHINRFNNFHVEIIEENNKNIHNILDELEADGFFN